MLWALLAMVLLLVASVVVLSIRVRELEYHQRRLLYPPPRPPVRSNPSMVTRVH